MGDERCAKCGCPEYNHGSDERGAICLRCKARHAFQPQPAPPPGEGAEERCDGCAGEGSYVLHYCWDCLQPSDQDARSVTTARLRAELEEAREREGAVCPEDVPFDEYIRALTKRAEAAEADAAWWATFWRGLRPHVFTDRSLLNSWWTAAMVADADERAAALAAGGAGKGES